MVAWASLEETFSSGAATCLADHEVARPSDMKIVSLERNETNAAGSRSAMVFAKRDLRLAHLFLQFGIGLGATVAASTSDAHRTSIFGMSGLYLHCVIMLPTGHEARLKESRKENQYGRESRGRVYGTGQGRGADHRLSETRAGSRKCEHGVILKIVTTNICGSDQHMVRGRTTAPQGLVLGHEITGEVIEAGRDVEFIKSGDLCLRALQHRLRPLPQLQGRQDRHLPERESGASRRGLRLRRHGRLGRRAGGVRAWCPTPISTSSSFPTRPGDGEDPRSDAAFRHLPDRLSRRRDGGRRPGLDRVCGRRRTGRPGMRGGLPSCWAPRW